MYSISETVIIWTSIALYIPNLLITTFCLSSFTISPYVEHLQPFPSQNISRIVSTACSYWWYLPLSLFTLNKAGHDASSYCLRFTEFRTFCLRPLSLLQLYLTLPCCCLHFKAKIKFSFNCHRLTTATCPLSQRILS